MSRAPASFVVIVVAVAACAIAAGGARAHDDRSDDRWAATVAPARAGVVDVAIGGGAAYTPFQGPLGTPVTPNVVLAARWGITDNVEIAFPLLFTLSSPVPIDVGALDVQPRLCITAGVADAGYDSHDGVVVAPSVAASASLVGRRFALVGTVDGVAFAAGGLHTVVDGAGATAGFVYKIDDRLSVGFSGLVSAEQQGNGGARSVDVWTIGIGSAGGGVPADVQTVRFLVADPLSIELWTFADFRSVAASIGGSAGAASGLSAIGANVSATWRIDFAR